MVSQDNASMVADLRKAMEEHGLDAYYIPSEDAHQSEYLAPADARRGHISGFTGSAGFAIVTKTAAALWTDGRYFLQASQQLDPITWTLMKAGTPKCPTKEQWLRSVLPAEGGRVGIDPFVITYGAFEAMEKDLKMDGKQHTLVAVPENLIDLTWKERPARELKPIYPLELKYTGREMADKMKELRATLSEKRMSAIVFTSLDEIAWLLNLRGSDIPFNPVFFSYVKVTMDAVTLFCDGSMLTTEATAILEKNHVTVSPYADITPALAALGATLKASAGKMLVTPTCNAALAFAVGEEHCVTGLPSPVQHAKAIKNEVELEGFRRCHIRDAAALCKFFIWLEKRLESGPPLDEVDAADELERLRSEVTDIKGQSFDTISSTGGNGAIIHYKPEKPTAAVIDPSQIYLCDSGGQYKDGTTDVTRTFHFQEPTAYEKECYTRVLIGHIDIDTSIFPAGTTGYVLDAFARRSLWQAGLNFRHGTGHGVGAFLNVHEGPHGIGTRSHFNDVALKPGMTVTNEPGYYEEGKFGIRIENVLFVKKVETTHNFDNGTWLGFETVTMVPLSRKLMDFDLLTAENKQWINTYHQQCFEKVSPLLEPTSDAYGWLKRETQPL